MCCGKEKEIDCTQSLPTEKVRPDRKMYTTVESICIDKETVKCPISESKEEENASKYEIELGLEKVTAGYEIVEKTKNKKFILLEA